LIIYISKPYAGCQCTAGAGGGGGGGGGGERGK
jgi:hypothetical protein